MSGVLLRQIRRRSFTIIRNARLSSTTAQSCSSHSFKFNSFHLHFRHYHHHRNPLIVFRNCGGAGAEILSSRDIHSSGEIPAIVNCPRCSAEIHLVFSNRRDPALGYQAINLCRNCNFIYYFLPRKLLPLLQGSFLEIGRLKGSHNFVVQGTSEFLRERDDVIQSKGRGGGVGGSGIGGCNNSGSSLGSCSEEKDEWGGSNFGNDLPTPKEIRQALDKHVIGQEQAKKVLSVGVYNHYKRIFHAPSWNRATHFGDICIENDENDSVELEKSNVLLIGPTGSGKTLLAKTLARVVNVPFVTADATTLTQAGYVGEDVESILYKLLKAADFNVEAAQQGIIYIDEIDKIIKKAGSSNINRDVSGEGVQQALLKMLEGTIVSVPDNETQKYSSADNIQIDTKDILFICGGAFVDLEKTISERRQDSSMGFGAPVRTNMRIGGHTNAILTSSLLESVDSGDLVTYGLIPEFVGRFPILVCLSALNETQLVQVLTDPKDALGKQYKKMFGMNGVKLHFTEEALKLIAKKAVAKNTGARGLRAILENILIEAMYEIPDANTGENRIDAVVVDKEAVGSVDAHGCGAKILRGNGAWKRYISKTTSVDSVVCSM